MNLSIFEKFPVFNTERLKLREFEGIDSKLMFDFNSDLKSIEYVPREPYADISVAEKRVKTFQPTTHLKMKMFLMKKE